MAKCHSTNFVVFHTSRFDFVMKAILAGGLKNWTNCI